MFVIGLGTANPPQRYTQTECWEALKVEGGHFARLSSRSQAILKKVLLGNNGIDTRHLALDSLLDAFDVRPDTLHARFARHAPVLGTEAASHALEQAQCSPADIDAILISTCTGYLCPGLTSYLSERLGLRDDVLTLDLVGQGCAAAIPNWRAAQALIAAGRCERVLSVCLEICSAAFYFDDDPGVLISACLFGDGAGASVFSNRPGPGPRRIQWNAAVSQLRPADRDLLRFEMKDGLLRNVLSLRVPSLAAEHAGTVLERGLAASGVGRSQVSTWILHPGGRDVLMALKQRLGLSREDLCWSEQVLKNHGNLSSASVYFVLQEALRGNAPGGFWWMASFGAGFSSHGVVLEVE
jgi:3,5-dihydroxyphenylacetyl-CoA synthase